MAVRPAALVFIFVLVVVDVIAMGIVIPVLPKLVETFEGGDTARAAAVYGVFGTAWALMQFVFMPVLGAISDRFGRRPVILISCLGLGLDYFLMALAPNLAWLFVGRVISGITAASVATALAYIADVTPAEKRAAAFGMVGAGFGLGFTLGPALGGVLGGVDPRLAVLGGGRSRARERRLRLLRAARVAAEGKARHVFVEARQPGGIAQAPALAPRALRHVGGALSHAALARRVPGGHGALHGLPLRLGPDGGGTGARRRGHLLDDRAGRTHQARGAVDRRAPRARRGTRLRRGGHGDLRGGCPWAGSSSPAFR